MLNMWITIISHFDSSPDDGGYKEYKVERQKESEDKDMRRGMITSIDTLTQMSIKFRIKQKANKNMGIGIELNINNTYENGNKCVRVRERREMRMYD